MPLVGIMVGSILVILLVTVVFVFVCFKRYLIVVQKNIFKFKLKCLKYLLYQK